MGKDECTQTSPLILRFILVFICCNYLYIELLICQAGQFDIEKGWSLDERNWAILTAAENVVETAEQVIHMGS